MARSVAEKKEQLPAPIDFSVDSSAGFEGLTQSDLAIPFISLMQKTSQKVEELDHVQPGTIFNSVTQETQDSICVIPVSYKREFVEWVPTEQGGGYVAAHAPNSDTTKSATWVEGKCVLPNGNQLVETANHFVLVVTDSDTTRGLVTMSSSQLKKNRRWNSLMLGLKMQDAEGNSFTPARYSHQYHLSVCKEQKANKTWFGWEIELLGPVTDASLYSLAKDFAQQVQAGEVNLGPRKDDDLNDEIPF